MNKTNVVAICGSTRPSVLQEAVMLKLGSLALFDVKFKAYNQLGDLPIYRRVKNEDPPESVADLCRTLRAADGIIICLPEIKFGVPGSLINALEWAVPFGVFDYKHVIFLTPGGAKNKSMETCLSQVSALLYVRSSLFVYYVKAGISKENINADGVTCTLLEKILNDIKQARYQRSLASAV